MEELVEACGQSWEIVRLNSRLQDYGKTTAEWLRRFRANKDKIMASGWGIKVMTNGETVWTNYAGTCRRA